MFKYNLKSGINNITTWIKFASNSLNLIAKIANIFKSLEPQLLLIILGHKLVW